MGFSETKQQQAVDLGFDSDQSNSTKKWVIAGIPLRSPLKPIFTNPERDGDHDGEEEFSTTTTTPTGEEARIPKRLTCPPPAPRKKKASLKCNYGTVGREFFTPPDLETVFIRHIEKAS